MASGSDKKKQKLFENVLNLPLITGDPEQTILGTISVPELHLLLGIKDYGKILDVYYFHNYVHSFNNVM